MMKIFTFLCITCLYTASAFAQDTSLRFTVIDVLDESKTRQETWLVREEEEEIDDSTAYRFTKQSKLATRVEIHSRWYKETRIKGEETYTKEFFSTDPNSIEDSEKGFGFTEEKSVSTGKVLRNWPVFFEVKEHPGTTRRIIFRNHVSGREYMDTIRDFIRGNTILPHREELTHFKDGKLIRHTITSRNE